MTEFKRGNWSAQELERLRTLYPKCPVERTASLLRRSVDSVRRRAEDLFAGSARRGGWTAADDHQLRVSYGVLDQRSLALVLGRSERDVAQRIEKLRRLRRRGSWTRREQTMLKQLYGSRSDEDLEVCLSRSRTQIRRMAEQLCLRKDKKFVARNGEVRPERKAMPRWTEQDIARLCALYPDHGNLDIARELGRSVASVANKASQLQLRKSDATLREMGRRNVRSRYAGGDGVRANR